MKKSSAVTLVELIIATLIVSMVVIGVFSAEYALHRTSEMSGGDAQTAVQTKSLAGAVRSSVKMVHGDAVNTGITINLLTKTICFRHDILVAGSYTPANYADDSHTCYTQIGTNVYSCERVPNPAVCTNADTLLGALVTDQFSNAVIQPTSSVTAGLCTFKMILVGQKTPVAAVIAGGVPTAGTDVNPQTAVKVFENAGM